MCSAQWNNTITRKICSAALCQRVLRLSKKFRDGCPIMPSMRAVDSDIISPGRRLVSPVAPCKVQRVAGNSCPMLLAGLDVTAVVNAAIQSRDARFVSQCSEALGATREKIRQYRCGGRRESRVA